MITIILNHHNKYAEVDMPAMYEELQLALWKLGLDRVPEKYTLQDLEATFRYQSPLEYFVLRLLEGEMTLLDAVSAIYTVIAPPRPIMAQVQILSSGFRSITELRQEIDRMIKSSARFGSTCFFPVRGWLVGLDGEMEPARDAVMLQHADVIWEKLFHNSIRQRICHNISTVYIMTANFKLHRYLTDTQFFTMHSFCNLLLKLWRIAFVRYSFRHGKTPHFLVQVLYHTCLTNGVQFKTVWFVS